MNIRSLYSSRYVYYHKQPNLHSLPQTFHLTSSIYVPAASIHATILSEANLYFNPEVTDLCVKKEISS